MNMSYHHCPIEPSDWTDGPDYLEGADCDACGGTGLLNENDPEPCPECRGEGFIAPDYESDQQFYDEGY